MVVGLPAGGSSAVGEVARITVLDLSSRQAGPFAGVSLDDAGELEDRTDAEHIGDQLRRLTSAAQRRGTDEIDGADAGRGCGGLATAEVGERRVGLTLPEAGFIPHGLAVPHQEDPGHGPARYRRYARSVAVLRLFAQAREAAGVASERIDAPDVGSLVAVAERRFGPAFAAVVPMCRIWVNGDVADRSTRLAADDEVALLPPVSGGA